MNTTFSASLSRTVLAAGLAIAGTLVSFAVTTAPAQAGAAGYTAKLSTALQAPKQKVVNGVVWHCAGDSCTGPVDGARAVNTCVQVVKAFGQVSSFATPKGELGAEDLQRCNAVG